MKKKRKMYAILVIASRIVVVDADSESEAQKLAMENVEIYSDNVDEARTEQADLTDADVKMYLRHDSQDFRETA